MVKEHTLEGIEVMHMIRKGQLFAREGIPRSAVLFIGRMTLTMLSGQTLLALHFAQNHIRREADFLASADENYLTGQTFCVDSGMVIL